MTISAEMIGPVEYSGDLHYAALTGTRVWSCPVGKV
jgi:hypothetical protein